MDEQYLDAALHLRSMVDHIGGWLVPEAKHIDEIMEHMPYRNMPEEGYKVIMVGRDAFVYRIRNMRQAENVEALLEKRKVEIAKEAAQLIDSLKQIDELQKTEPYLKEIHTDQTIEES